MWVMSVGHVLQMAQRYFKPRDVIAGKLKIETDIVSQSRGGRLSEADLRQIQGASTGLRYSLRRAQLLCGRGLPEVLKVADFTPCTWL
eukprot:g27976.t1